MPQRAASWRASCCCTSARRSLHALAEAIWATRLYLIIQVHHAAQFALLHLSVITCKPIESQIWKLLELQDLLWIRRSRERPASAAKRAAAAAASACNAARRSCNVAASLSVSIPISNFFFVQLHNSTKLEITSLGPCLFRQSRSWFISSVSCFHR